MYYKIILPLGELTEEVQIEEQNPGGTTALLTGEGQAPVYY